MRTRFSLSGFLALAAGLSSRIFGSGTTGDATNFLTIRRKEPLPRLSSGRQHLSNLHMCDYRPERGWWSEQQSEDDAQWHLKRAKGRRIRRAERANPSGYARRNDPRLA